jgi:xanthine dehydrogenase accessory factor
VAAPDLELFSTLRDWQSRGHEAALATVARTYGSSPRPAGSMVLIRGDGAVVGSVSGGCIEQDLIERMRNGVPTLPRVLSYGGTPEENQRIGLPCGGKLALVLEAAPDAALVDALCSALDAAEPVARRLDLASGRSVLFTPGRTDTFSWDGTTLVAVHRPQRRLLLIGAVHTARYLAEMAQALDYAVLVCDPREEYRATWNVPNTTLLESMPDDAVAALRPDGRTAIVALTHDPKLDDMALLEALRSDAFYVGALGSRRNNAKRRERLTLFDLAPEQIARLRGPVGLPIGSHTPAEIAVAVLADLIAVRNGVQLVAATERPAAPAACADFSA